jgi:hypothetical protein
MLRNLFELFVLYLSSMSAKNLFSSQTNVVLHLAR